jgi:hypothetical protein
VIATRHDGPFPLTQHLTDLRRMLFAGEGLGMASASGSIFDVELE